MPTRAPTETPRRGAKTSFAGEAFTKPLRQVRGQPARLRYPRSVQRARPRLIAGALLGLLLSGCTAAESAPVPFSAVVPLEGCGTIRALAERDGELVGIAGPWSRESSQSGCLFAVKPGEATARVLTRLEDDGHALAPHSLGVHDGAAFVASSYEHKEHGVTIEVHRWRSGQLSELLERPLEWVSIYSGRVSLTLPAGEPTVALSRTESSWCGTGLDRTPRTLMLNGDTKREQASPVQTASVAAATALGGSSVVLGGRDAIPGAAIKMSRSSSVAVVTRLSPTGAQEWTRELYAPGAQDFLELINAAREAADPDTPFRLSDEQRERADSYDVRPIDVAAKDDAVFVLARFGDKLELHALAAEDGSSRWRAVVGDDYDGRIDVGAEIGVTHVVEHGADALRVARVVYDESGRQLRAGSRQVKVEGDYYGLELLTASTGHVWLAASRDEDLESSLPMAWVVDLGPIASPS